jgi:hypothetical protein
VAFGSFGKVVRCVGNDALPMEVEGEFWFTKKLKNPSVEFLCIKSVPVFYRGPSLSAKAKKWCIFEVNLCGGWVTPMGRHQGHSATIL